MIKLLVISDDFTGALDTGARFAGTGLATKVLNQVPEDRRMWSETLKEMQANPRIQVLVVDARTRHLDGGEAYQKVWNLVNAAKEAGIPYIYKKTDSGLRGNIGKELEAALMASGEQYLTFIPAFPAMDRITVRGIHYVEGVPIHESAFGRDPFEPVLSAKVEDLFGQVPVKTVLYGESGPYERGKDREIGIFDASSQEHMEKIMEDLMGRDGLGVMAGCAGFASVVGDFLKLENEKARPQTFHGESGKPVSEVSEDSGIGMAGETPLIRNRLLIICGSINEITRGQIEYAEKNGMKRITLTPGQQFSKDFLQSEEGKAWLGGVKADCEAGVTCIIETGISHMEQVEEFRKKHAIPLEQARITISRNLGRILKFLLNMGLESTFMIIGGDTLASFMAETGCGEITIYRELDQGTVLSSANVAGKGQWIISKSGGFGEPQLLMEVEQLVKGWSKTGYQEERNMLEQYSLAMPGTVYSGMGALDRIKEIARGRFKKAVVFTDKGVEQAGLLTIPVNDLKEAGADVHVIGNLPAEPDCDQAQAVIDEFRRAGGDLIVAIGGGSVMDVAKLASIAASGSPTVRELLDDPGLGKKTVATLMIPTTGGTGSEATMNSIVAVPEKKLKVGIVNRAMIPDFVILDGSLIRNLPKKIGASTGIDAMAHAVECYTSNKANPFSNLFAKEAARLIFGNILEACENPEALEAKTNMLTGAFYAGVAISSSGTTAVHALSYPLGGTYHIPHGVSNAMLLLPVMRFNKPACAKELAELYDAVAEQPGFGAEPGSLTLEEKADKLLDLMEGIIRRLEIPSSLSEFGVGKEDLEDLVAAGLDVKRLLDNNRREISYEDARSLYLEIMG